MYEFPYHVIDSPEKVSDIPDCYETCRLQKRPFVVFLARQLMKGDVR
jgi:hypothetical protein